MQKYRGVFVPILTVIIGLVFGALVMLVFNFDPIAGYKALYTGAFGTPFATGQTIRAATPLIFTGLGFAVASTAGFFNIGLAGQALAGWLVSVWIGVSFPEGPKLIILPLAVLGGMAAGALWAAIAGFLKAFFNTSEVIVTIMLNYVAVYISDYVVRNVMTDRMDRSPFVGENASLDIQWLTDITKGSTIHAGIFLAIIGVFIVYILMKRTTVGFEFEAVGLNRHAANYAGMNAKKNIVLAMVISGGLAGLGGVMSGLGEFGNIFMQNGVAPDIGFDGMAVALLGANNPIGVLFSAFLFGALKTGGNLMPLAARVPQEVVDIVTGSIIFFVGSSYIITYFLDKRQKPVMANKEVITKTEGGDE